MRKRIATARGDLTGDGAPENLVLSGEQSAGSAYWQNIELEITDGRTGRTARVPLAHDGGYDPQLVLGSMTARDGGCADRAGNGDQQARDTLIEHNLRLVVYIAKTL